MFTMAAVIAQLDPPQIGPDTLVGVEFRDVARQLLDVQEQPSAAMAWGSISDRHQLAPDLAQQEAQETDDSRRVVRLLLHLHEQTPIRGDAADRGDVVIGERRPQHGSSHAWCPDAHGRR